MKVASNKLSDIWAFYQSELLLTYDEGELEAIFELVCEHYLGLSKTEVKRKIQENINQSELLKIYDIVKLLKIGMPVQYVLKEAWFYGLNFMVNQHTLIPRPETEELVDLVLKNNILPGALSVLDIGTGSGCIPITIKKNRPTYDVTGIDISEEALLVATHNAIRNNTSVSFVQYDMLTNSVIPNTSFHIIVSNPPYILKSERGQMAKRVLDYEPHLALFVEDEAPILFYKQVVNFCRYHLMEKGYLFFELNPLTALDVKNYADASQIFTFTKVLTDMSGKERFLIAQKI